MDKRGFWAIVNDAARRGGGDFSARYRLVHKQLTKLVPDEIMAFDEILRELFVAADRWDLRMASYIAMGGCSDDGFMDFCWWLISRGEAAYSSVMADPETLADFVDGEDDIAFMEFGSVAADAYEEKLGMEIPRHEPVGRPPEPTGEAWDGDPAALRRRFPKLYARYWDLE